MKPRGQQDSNLKLATPKKGTISTMRSADCRICGGRIRQHEQLRWFHIASGDEAC